MHVAIDLGAGSGRALVGAVTGEGLTFREVHRFAYGPRPSAGHLRWDMARLEAGLREGLAAARIAATESGASLASVGVDAWGVDYGLIDRAGRLLDEPIAYRDPRTEGVMAAVCARLGREAIFARTGIQFMPINTLYQLVAHVRDGLPAGTDRLLMMPDLCHLLLSGSRTGEYTNASTTQLLDAAAGTWDDGLIAQLGLPRDILPPLVPPGADLGPLRAAFDGGGGEAIRVVAPATHDTASAVVGTPLRPGWAFISSGTWSLVGVERRAPLRTAEALAANFTNEGGAGGTIRLLRNVMGLWLLEACRREWGSGAPDHEALVAAAAALPRAAGSIDVEDIGLLNPPSMLGAIRAQLAAAGAGEPPGEPAAIARVIFDSLAAGYARVIATIERLTGEAIPGIHIVGGGSRNAYLNQATADATGKPVLAGPVEATAAGNLIVQAVAAGRLGSIAEGRERLARSIPSRAFEPRPGLAAQ